MDGEKYKSLNDMGEGWGPGVHGRDDHRNDPTQCSSICPTSPPQYLNCN